MADKKTNLSVNVDSGKVTLTTYASKPVPYPGMNTVTQLVIEDMLDGTFKITSGDSDDVLFVGRATPTQPGEALIVATFDRRTVAPVKLPGLALADLPDLQPV